MEENNRPKVGIAAIVVKNGKFLLGKRKGSHGAATYASPGGHLEYMESIENCVKREVMEEAGLEVTNVRFLRLNNLKDFAPKHYIDIAMLCDWKSGEPKVMEPEKCEGWAWYDFDKLPSPIFGSWATIIEAIKTGRNYFDN